MRRVNAAAIKRRRGIWWTMAMLLTVAGLVLTLNSCQSPTPPQPQAIVEKGTPYGDLLVPRLQTSVTDRAVGVPVESPVTISAEAGVLGAVTLVNDQGRVVKSELSPDGVTWRSAEPLGYNKQYTLNAEALGLGGMTRSRATFETHSPENLTMPYVLPNDGEIVVSGNLSPCGSTKTSQTASPPSEPSGSPPIRQSRAPSTG